MVGWLPIRLSLISRIDIGWLVLLTSWRISVWDVIGLAGLSRLPCLPELVLLLILVWLIPLTLLTDRIGLNGLSVFHWELYLVALIGNQALIRQS